MGCRMIQFEKELMITGAEQRTRKDDSTYILVHCLGENGQTFSCVFKGDANKVMQLKKMSTYQIDFELSLGKFTHLSVIDIKEV
jgi:hypothetical protein